MLLVAAASLVVRLRRARGEERQQVKLFVYTVACVLFLFPFPLFGTSRAYGFHLFPLIPISAGVAILKYRLYDIDVVIKRTLIYGALTAFLGGAYLLGVLALQWALSPSSDFAIAGSTLAVAALFRPARTRIQAIVDRRFYRGAYDAARTVEEFGAQLRNEVSLEALTRGSAGGRERDDAPRARVAVAAGDEPVKARVLLAAALVLCGSRSRSVRRSRNCGCWSSPSRSRSSAH